MKYFVIFALLAVYGLWVIRGLRRRSAAEAASSGSAQAASGSGSAPADASASESAPTTFSER